MPIWSSPTSEIALSPDQLDLWRLDGELLTAETVQRLANVLSAEERQRADQFRHPQAKAEFMRTRGWLRHVLASYLRVSPEQLRFAYGPHGKPRLADQSEGQGLCFNVSHSHGVALLAVAWNRLVGVDVEQVRINKDLEGLAKRYFSPNEVTALQGLPPEQQVRAFFLAWTRKEAFIKAVGSGMSFPLDGFDVSLSPDGPAQLLAVRSGETRPDEWTLINVELGDEYAGAAIVKGRPVDIRQWQSALVVSSGNPQ